MLVLKGLFGGSPKITLQNGNSLARLKITLKDSLSGGLPLEGVVAENFVPALESLSSLGFRREEFGMSREFCGMSRTPAGCSKSLCEENFVRIFRSLDRERDCKARDLANKAISQKNSRRLWRSRRRKSSSAPEGGRAANFPAAIFRCRKVPKP